MASNFTYQYVPIADLLVNTTNPRFRPVDNQREAIEQMLYDQQEKIVRLAEDILNEGVNPSELTIITPEPNNPHKYIVQEGNRRVTTLKLLRNPELADEKFKFIYTSRFRKLADDFAANPVDQLFCVVYPAKNDTSHWVKLKHTGENRGVGTASWNAQQSTRFSADQTGKPSEALQIIDFLSLSTTFDPTLKQKLPEVNISTLERLLGTKATKEFLGIRLNKGYLYATIHKLEIERGLKKIVTDLLNGLSARDLDKRGDRELYIRGFSEEYIPDQTKETTKEWALDSPDDSVLADKSTSNQSGAEGTKGSGDDDSKPDGSKESGEKDGSKDSADGSKPKPVKPKPLSTDREFLIPKSFVAHVVNNRANKIYHELKKLKVADFENATGVLFRVFVEISTDIYLEKFPQPSVTKDSKFRIKVEVVAKHMEANAYSDKHKLKGVRNAISNDHSVLSIHTFNAIVHNADYSPDALSLKKAWDNIERYMEAIWNNV